VRLLIKEGAEVKILMTPASTDFVSPLVLSTLSKNDVLISMTEENSWANHVELGRWADLMLIAPASANTIAKMATGICDNLLLAVYLSATCPIMLAPAMDDDMYSHPTFTSNIGRLESFGHTIIPSEHGELASGLIGMGRMAEPEKLLSKISDALKKKQKLSNKKALVTAGPTFESIDPVRFIGNRSTGKMGKAIAEKLAEEGCSVELILGPSSLEINHPNISTVRVESAEEMYTAAIACFEGVDIAVMTAAVADYTPSHTANNKIKKAKGGLKIELKRTKDILKHLGSIKTDQQILAGFALETQNGAEFALKKLKSKNADFIVLNSLQDAGAGFGHDTNKIRIFDNEGNDQEFELKSKTAVAQDIVNKIVSLIHK